VKLQKAAEIRPPSASASYSPGGCLCKSWGGKRTRNENAAEAMRLGSGPQDLEPDGIPSNAAPQE